MSDSANLSSVLYQKDQNYIEKTEYSFVPYNITSLYKIALYI